MNSDAFIKFLPEGTSVSGNTPLWWEAQNIPWQLVVELRRRSNSNNIGAYNNQNMCLDFENQYSKYKGPMTPWVRFFSNGTGTRVNPSVPVSKYLKDNNNEEKVYNGFLLEGGHGFFRGYGVTYKNNELNRSNQILGYDADGNAHYIKENLQKSNFYNIDNNKFNPALLPPPGILSVNIQTPKDLMTVATINWRCYGLAQLEYMIPFFLTPRINVFLEFGWNLFNIKSLINYKNTSECVTLIKNPENCIENIYNSLGNYGSVIGIIRKYNIEQRDGVVFNCRTEIISRQALYAGFKVNVDRGKRESVISFLKQQLPKLKDTIGSTLAYKQKYGVDYLNKVTSLKYLLDQKTIKIKELNSNIDTYTAKLNKNALNNYPNGEKIKYTLDKEFDRFIENGSLNYVKIISNKSIVSSYIVDAVMSELKKGILTDSTIRSKAQKLLNNDVNALKKFYKEKEKAEEEREDLLNRYIKFCGNFIRKINIENNRDYSRVSFYNGADEDRFFYNPNNNIEYKSGNTTFKTDLVDGSFKNEKAGKFGWVNLDFLFELINYIICDNTTAKSNKIDISDIIITAHPNLISADPNVLIPNPIAPKINIAKPLLKADSNEELEIFNGKTLDAIDAYIQSNDKETVLNSQSDSVQEDILKYYNRIEENTYLTTQTSETINFISQTSTANIDSSNEYLNKCQSKCQETFLTNTSGSNNTARDNLDMVLNYNYYYIGNHEKGSASFPSSKKIVPNNRSGSYIANEYSPYLYGYLKYIYISVNKIIEIANDLEENESTLKNLVKGILNTINDAVCGFWQLDVISLNNTLTIVDKNVYMERGKEIYMFEVGTTNSVIKNFSFNITLTNEQTTQILYSGGKNAVVDDNQNNEEQDSGGELSQRNLPSLAYNDRLEELIRKNDLSSNQNNSTQNKDLIIGTQKPLRKKDTIIENIQSGCMQSNTLFVRVKKGDAISNDKENYSYIMLNLPSELKAKLKKILYTPLVDDYEKLNGNQSNMDEGGYTGPADNFTITLTLDGIMGFRLFQYFAIANLPAPYKPENTIFMVTEVKHQITNRLWETVVTGMLRSSAGQGYKFKTI